MYPSCITLLDVKQQNKRYVIRTDKNKVKVKFSDTYLKWQISLIDYQKYIAMIK